MNGKNKKEIPIWVCIVAGIIIAIIIGKKIGTTVGSAAGTVVGTAVGSYNGFTEKLQEGKKEGEKEGLSADDTTTKVGNSLKEIAKLEVLVSSFKLNDYHKLGNKYAALYLLKANALFTVDLSKASLNKNEIRVPQPEVTVYIDERYTEKAVESQRKFFNGSAEDGFNAYINSMSNLEENAENSIKNDENLMKSARNSAEKQIRRLIREISSNGEELSIVWE